jgi:kynurenine formamidase
MSNATAANRKFDAEKENTVVLFNTGWQVEEMTDEQILQQKLHWNTLTVPRRPTWNREMSSFELHRLEADAFLEWRRKIAE